MATPHIHDGAERREIVVRDYLADLDRRLLARVSAPA